MLNLPIFHHEDFEEAIKALEKLDKRLDGTYDPDVFPDVEAAHSVIVGLVFAMRDLKNRSPEFAAQQLQSISRLIKDKFV